MDDDAIWAVGGDDGSGNQVLVAKPGPVGAGYLDEHVEIARVGAPGGNLHPAQGEGVDLYREGPGLLVGEPVDEEVGVELSKRRCSCFEVGGRSADDGVRVGRSSARRRVQWRQLLRPAGNPHGGGRALQQYDRRRVVSARSPLRRVRGPLAS